MKTWQYVGICLFILYICISFFGRGIEIGRYEASLGEPVDKIELFGNSIKLAEDQLDKICGDRVNSMSDQLTECALQRDSYEKAFLEMDVQSTICLDNVNRAINLAEKCTELLEECRNVDI